ncbi:hypothetical protein [Chryseobacterium daeguense]|uniref:hypothetical protein n=1 Tax=Chryseobacterium daeguense TaxID=412438 RepID=UPI000423869E|nr:hypothetical protein [Chryseobacterium daeguense]
MKSLYIIAFLALSINIYAQENKRASETQEAPNYKESKEFEARMMKDAEERAAQKPSTTLVSEQGLDLKQAPKQTTANNSGKTIPGSASLDEIRATIPGRQARKVSPAKHSNSVQGLMSTPDLTISDIKKTIPKN